MSEYERMVSYFYRYDNGNKMNNCGFSKVDLRQGMLCVHLQITDVQTNEALPYRVYLFFYESGKMRLRELGFAKEQRGLLKFQLKKNAESILEGRKLSDFGGILLFHNKSHYYGTQWKDEPIMIDRAESLSQGNIASNNSYKSEASDTSNVFSSRSKEAQEQPQEQPQEQVIKPDKEQQQKERYVSNDSTNTNINPSKPGNFNTNRNEGSYDNREVNSSLHQEIESFLRSHKEFMEQKSQAAKISSEDDTAKEKQSGIAYLLSHRNPLPAFANHEVLQCVRIMPEDIGLTHRDNWEYGNNSFLLHGFYNYRYLLLGCIHYGDGKQQYILGVPGIFSNKDKYLANIFRFHDFIPIRTCPFRTGEFGYWIGKLKE